MKNHRASFLMDDANTRVMNTLSHKHTNASRNRIWARCRRNGDNAIYLYASNVGDDKRYPVNPSLSIGVVRSWVAVLQWLNSTGLRPIVWFFADDSKSISQLPTARLTRYVHETIPIIDPYVIGYVPALEANEHLGLAKTRAIVNAIRGASSKPIGIHTTRDLEKTPDRLRAWAALGDEWFHQFGFDMRVSEYVEEARRVRTILGRTFVGCEYDKSSTRSRAKAIGKALLQSGHCHSVGNGAGAVLPPSPAPTPPTKPRLSRERTIELLKDVERRTKLRPQTFAAAYYYIAGGE